MSVHLCLLFILVFMNLIPEHIIDRKKRILPLSFAILAVYFAIRYDYGLDFWNYYYAFEHADREDYFGTEILFYRLLKVFPYYFQFIAFQSFVVIGCLYYLVRKYINPTYYAIFFFLFFTMDGMAINMISALRSTFAACIIWLAIDLFYLKKKRLLLYFTSVAVATFFHNSAVVFIVFPFIIKFLNGLGSKALMIIFVVADILSIFFTVDFFSIIFGSSDFLSGYQGHLNNVENATIFGAIHKGIWLLPAYMIVKKKDRYDTPEKKVIFTLSNIYFILFFLGMTFQQRFTTYLFIFTIIAMAYALEGMSRDEKRMVIYPMVLVCSYDMYLFYNTMAKHLMDRYSEGNYLFFHTIFEQAFI